MKQYKELLTDLLENGTQSTDRTGVGTLRKAGHTMRFDLQQGLPVVTTKKIHMKSVIHEVLWMLSGDTNIRYLVANGVSIWNEWADENGNLGPVYGHQFRNFGAKPAAVAQKKAVLRPGVSVTYLGVGNGAGSTNHVLGKTWEGMMARCYDRNSSSYHLYGAKGVSVCDAWLEFVQFAHDAEQLPGYSAKINADARYVLDKDIRGTGFEYGPDTCIWVTDAANTRANLSTLYTVAKDGIEYKFVNIRQFCDEHGICSANFSDLWTGNKNAKERGGFTFVKKEPLRKGIDQIQNALDLLRTKPDDRGIIVNAWNAADLPLMALRPCHCMFQLLVIDGKLNLILTQRSCDSFLGVPFNVAFYGLLTHMFAQQTGIEVGELIWNGGDVHLYKNHIEQAGVLLSRPRRPLPQLELRKADSMFDYRIEDFKIVGYNPWPAIKAPVAV
jgi:thymidylate synthase